MLLFLALAACASDPTSLLLTGARLPGGEVADVAIAGARFTASPVDGATPVDLSGRFVAPAFIDSHVHLAYRPDAEGMARGGVAAVVDLAAPIETLAAPPELIRVLGAGPMITAVGGYPTRSWGADGYGLECADAAAAAAAVDQLHAAGARVIKVPVTGPPALDDDALAAVVARAHALGLKVVAHALSDGEAARAAAAGVDALAHAPTEALAPSTVDAWRGRAVIGTVRAFGSATATDDLRALRAAGVTVLYGTDFGNTTTAGIDRIELERMLAAGLDAADVLAAGTEVPAAFWGLEDLGAIAPGKAASFLVLARDPLVDPLVLAEPEQVWLDGVRVR